MLLCMKWSHSNHSHIDSKTMQNTKCHLKTLDDMNGMSSINMFARCVVKANLVVNLMQSFRIIQLFTAVEYRSDDIIQFFYAFFPYIRLKPHLNCIYVRILFYFHISHSFRTNYLFASRDFVCLGKF